MTAERLAKLIEDLKILSQTHVNLAKDYSNTEGYSNAESKCSYHKGQAEAYQNVVIALEGIRDANSGEDLFVERANYGCQANEIQWHDCWYCPSCCQH